MATFTYDHIHLRSPNPEATAQYYERMFGAEVIRSMQQGKPRIDLKLGGAKIFIAPVDAGSGVNPPPTTPYQGLDHFGLAVSGIDAIAAELKAKGVEFTKEPTTVRPGMRVCFIAVRKASRSSCSTATSERHANDRHGRANRFEVTRSEAEWRKLLTPEQYEVMREHGTERPGSCALNFEKRHGTFCLRRLRAAAVQVEEEVRERHRLAELQRSGAGFDRDHDRSKLRHGPHRGALQPLRQPSRPRVRGRPAADASALLHQRRGDELPAGVRTTPAFAGWCFHLSLRRGR